MLDHEVGASLRDELRDASGNVNRARVPLVNLRRAPLIRPDRRSNLRHRRSVEERAEPELLAGVIGASSAPSTISPMEWIGELERVFATSLYPLRVPIAIGLVVALVALLLVARRRDWFGAARRHPGRSTALAAAMLLIGGPIAWYLGSPLFIRTSLAEPAPASSDPPAASSDVDTPAGVRAGSFVGADEFHFGSGTARLIETSPGTWTVRFEDFSVRNGPDLYVYLSPDPAGYADGAVELGTLKATDGNFNTDVPGGTDVGRMRSVVIWCRQFAVQFAVAALP